MELNNFNNFNIINSSKVRNTERKILFELYTTNKPLYKSSEIIALFTRAKDKRTYSTLTIILEPKANELTNFDTITKGLLDALDRGDFNEIGENKSLFYATLEPTASFINKKRAKA